MSYDTFSSLRCIIVRPPYKQEVWSREMKLPEQWYLRITRETSTVCMSVESKTLGSDLILLIVSQARIFLDFSFSFFISRPHLPSISFLFYKVSREKFHFVPNPFIGEIYTPVLDSLRDFLFLFCYLISVVDIWYF